MKYKVLITTSGIGNRLGDITKFTNKSLVRVGDKPALSYIIEAYPEEIELVMTVGYFGDHVRQFVKLAYPERKVTFVDVYNYDGPGSSLAYSILQAEKEIDCPFIFHACDTIVLSPIKEPDCDWLGGLKHGMDNHSYVSFDIGADDLVVKIRDKDDFGGDFNYIGLAGIFSYHAFFAELNTAYYNDNQNVQLSDVASIKRMLNYTEFRYDSCEWYDIGNIESLKATRSKLKGKLNVLDKSNEAIFLINDNIVKFFHDSAISKNRVKRANVLKGLVPAIIESSDNFYKYQFVKAKLLADCVTEEIFEKFLVWSKDNLWKKQQAVGDFKQVCYDFYFQKTRMRLAKFIKESGIKDEECIINGIVVPPVSDMIDGLDVDWLCDVESYQYHGDFILDNSLYVNENEFVLVDWRQDFGGSTITGDIYYDLAKLNHNLVFNHDIVSKDLFTIDIKEDTKCDILRSNTLVRCQAKLFDFINKNGFDAKKVSLLSAIIWINMSPLHHFPLNNFLFYFGKLNLWKAIKDMK